jgi:hypothetical protein
MKKLKALLFKFLPNAAHYNFCMQVGVALSSASDAVKAALGALIGQFNTWLAKETALMEWVKKSTLTKQIAEADHRMDRALVALNAQVRALEYSTSANVAEAAHEVNNMLRNYGKVYVKPYEEQEGDVRTILQQLTGAYAVDITTLGIAPLVTELQGAFAEFQALLAQRDVKSLQKPAESFTVVRRGIEELYHQIAALVDANASVGNAGFAEIIDLLNPEIERLNAEFHRVRHDIATAQPEPIAPQPHTGEPVNPTPAVYSVNAKGETEKLELGKDYNLTYKNNKEVGNAECTVHGKGLFFGHKTVTFVIVNS